MAILEINLEKPALIEEYQYPEKRATSAGRTGSKSSGGNKGKLVGLLAVLVGVTVMAWKLKGRGGTEQTDFDEFEDEGEYEHGPEPEIGADEGGAKRKVAGLLGFVVALVTVVSAVRKARK